MGVESLNVSSIKNKNIQKQCLKCPNTSTSRLELISSPISTNIHKTRKIPTENEFQNIKNDQSKNKKYNKIKNTIIDTNNKKEIDENKNKELFLNNQIMKNDNRLNTNGNNQLSFNCNCIGKYSYKNTEAITIIKNDTNENNNFNTYYSTERKTFDKNDMTNNKINKSKTNKTNNCGNSSVNNKNPKNSINSISKAKTSNKTNSNLNINQNIKDNLIEKNEKESEKEKLCLDLEILNSWNLPIGLQLHIDQYGLKNSIRNEKDSITYFGYQKEEELNTNPYIDYLLGPKDQEYDEQFMGKHFQIRFDWNTKKYYIKDLGNGFGTFIKLINETKIKDNLLINIGETYIVFSFNNENENELMIKIFTGDEQCCTYIFNSNHNPCIIIGRDTSCDIIVEDKMLSRVHCCINYKEKENNEKCWYIKDGNMEGKKSTNDTWFYSAEETLIYDKMIFKTNHILFKCIYK